MATVTEFCESPGVAVTGTGIPAANASMPVAVRLRAYRDISREVWMQCTAGRMSMHHSLLLHSCMQQVHQLRRCNSPMLHVAG
jgi:hypothetical protein